MKQIVIGFSGLVLVAVLAGLATSWHVGVAIILVPLSVVYSLIKLSSTFRAHADRRIDNVMQDKSKAVLNN
jgi:uncharacterized membrane protein YuzA (DUF378 family)